MNSPSIDALKYHITHTDQNCMGMEAVMIKNELHIIGGDPDHNNDYNHLNFNETTGKFHKLHDCKFGYPQLIKLKHKIVSFGGYRDVDGYLDEVYEYDQINSNWIKNKERMPKPMIVDGVTAVLNQEFVILFGD